MRIGRLFLFITVALAATSAISSSSWAADSAAAAGRWERLPLPSIDGTKQKTINISDAAAESGGTLWIIFNNSIYYWNGQQFQLPKVSTSAEVPAAPRAQYCISFVGGSDRELYAICQSQKQRHRSLYKLSDGALTYLTDIYWDDSAGGSAVYISKSKKIYSYSNNYLEVWTGADWKRTEVRMRPNITDIMDTGSIVHFFCDGTLCAADAGDTFKTIKIKYNRKPASLNCDLQARLWGTDRMLVYDYCYEGFAVYDINSGEPVVADAFNAALENTGHYRSFTSNDNSIWIVVHPAGSEKCILTRISPLGEVTKFDGGELIPSQTHLEKGIIESTDGSFWFAASERGIAKLQGSALQLFDWRQWVNTGNVFQVVEGQKGLIYSISNQSIYSYDPSGSPMPMPASKELWTQYDLVSSHMCRDNEGNIWMALKGHANELSYWDGKEFTHVKVPFDTPSLTALLADDKGYVLAQTLYKPACWHTVNKGVAQDPMTMEAMLKLEAERGARRIVGYMAGRTGYSSNYVSLTGDRVAFHEAYPGCPQYFDGESVSKLMERSWDNRVLDSSKYSFLLSPPNYGYHQTPSSLEYTAMDRGQFCSLTQPLEVGSRWLFGPQGIQPYEDGLLKLWPNLYTTAEFASDKQFHLLYNRSASSVSLELAIGDALPDFSTIATPAYDQGYWGDLRSGQGFVRVFAGRIIQCYPSDSPVALKTSEPALVMEDKKHNLWIDGGYSGGQPRMFMKNLAGFELKADNVPTKCKNSFTVRVNASLPGLDAANLKLFWRIGGESWQGTGKPGDTVTAYFPHSGSYDVEILGMDELGGTTPQTLKFRVDAVVSLPHTKLTSANSNVVVNDAFWKPPVEATPSKPGAKVSLAYNIDSISWKEVTNGCISFVGLKAGSHLVEVAAVEDGEYKDATPIQLKVDYQPDWKSIINNKLAAIASSDASVSRAALAELQSFGPDIVPALNEKLDEIRRNQNAQYKLEELISRIQNPQNYGNY